MAFGLWSAKTRTALGLFIMAYNWNRTIRLETDKGNEIVIHVYSDLIEINLPDGDTAIIHEDEIEGFSDLLVLKR